MPAVVPEPALAIPYLRLVGEQLAIAGVSVPDWLGQCGLPADWLANAEQQVSLAQCQQLISEAVRLGNEPALGLLVGGRLQVNSHGMLGYAAISSVTVRQMLELFERYLRLRIALVSVRAEIHGGEVRMQFSEAVALGPIRRPLLEAVVLATKNVLDFITLGSCRVAYVAFGFERPAHAPLAEAMFDCPLRYDQAWCGFALPAALLDLPLQMADPAAFQHAVRICQQELEKRCAAESLAMRVQRLLLEKPGGFPGLAVTARRFHMTPRTLHRRLCREGTSFQEILDQVRHALALEHLKAGQLAIGQIAQTLGYTDVANFRRAFKRWQGMPPSDYRRSQSG